MTSRACASRRTTRRRCGRERSRWREGLPRSRPDGKVAEPALPAVVLWWNEAEHLPAKVLFSLPSGKEAKEVTFTKFASKAGKTIVSEMEIRDLLARGRWFDVDFPCIRHKSKRRQEERNRSSDSSSWS